MQLPRQQRRSAQQQQAADPLLHLTVADCWCLLLLLLLPWYRLHQLLQQPLLLLCCVRVFLRQLCWCQQQLLYCCLRLLLDPLRHLQLGVAGVVAAVRDLPHVLATQKHWLHTCTMKQCLWNGVNLWNGTRSCRHPYFEAGCSLTAAGSTDERRKTNFDGTPSTRDHYQHSFEGNYQHSFAGTCLLLLPELLLTHLQFCQVLLHHHCHH